jgi:Mg-chelatase subunit ChlD
MNKILRKIIFNQEKGQVMILFAAVLPIFIGITSMSVEVGMMYYAKNQLQITADASALAAVQELIANDPVGARNRAMAMAASNTVTGNSIALDPATDIEFGRWANGQFVPDGVNADAVRVTARRTSQSANGALPLYFAPLLGFNEVDITATAVAKLANIDLMLVLDRSGSMDDDTVYQNGVPVNGIQPMDALRVAAKSFIDDLKQGFDNVGIVSYSRSSSSPIDLRITSDLQVAKAGIDNIPQPNSYTNIGDGMDKALREFRSNRARTSTAKIMVLLSDGAPTCTESGSCNLSSWTRQRGIDYALAKAAEAAAGDIIIHTISLGAGADRTLMQQIAQATGGKEFFSSSGSDLSQVFQDIKEEIPVRLTQ